jgi:hypothetical protein
MDPSVISIICGVLAVVLLALIIMRRRGRAAAEE